MKDLNQEIEQALKDLSVNENGKTIAVEDSPIYKIIYKLHDGLFPQDFIFDSVLYILEGMQDYDMSANFAYEYIDEIADSLVSIYNHELLEWAKTFSHFVDEYNSEMGQHELDFITQLRCGQYWQLRHIGQTVLDELGGE